MLLHLFIMSIFAQETSNPKVYSSLGNTIYDNVLKIEKLQDIEKYSQFRSKIDRYLREVQDTKLFGFDVEAGSKSDLKLDYLYQLRKHKKVNDYFLRSVKNAFESAIESQDNELFIGIVNSGLINVKQYKKKIMAYYNAHKKSINPKGTIQKFIDEDLAWKNRKRWKPKTKQQLQEEKVARLRKNDKLDTQALERKLSEEVRVKKQKIRQTQEKELFN